MLKKKEALWLLVVSPVDPARLQSGELATLAAWWAVEIILQLLREGLANSWDPGG